MGYEKKRKPIKTPPDTISVVYGLEGGGGKNYSTTEQDTGQKWIDGTTPVYQKTINFGALPNAGTKNVAHGITGLDRLVAHQGAADNSSTGGNIAIPYGADGTSKVYMFVNATNVSIVTASDLTAYDTCYITLFYTKT